MAQTVGRNLAGPLLFLNFVMYIIVLGFASWCVNKYINGQANHPAWRSDSLSAAGSSSLVAWALTALAFGFAWKEIDIGWYRGWRLKVLEAFIIILTITQLLYILLLHAGVFSSKYGPGYRDTDYAMGGGVTDPAHKGGAAQATTGVV
ncbi:AWPM-19-like [Dillenia turbinata]|uniref:AWPM-19-like n=1 Tax=Dillenia turbinata TaxID=194707 RepID=A0AAN8UEV4_9MAGN